MGDRTRPFDGMASSHGTEMSDSQPIEPKFDDVSSATDSFCICRGPAGGQAVSFAYGVKLKEVYAHE